MNKSYKCNQYIRKETYSISEVLNHIEEDKILNYKKKIDFDGDLIKMKSQRYYVFKFSGTKCHNCGIEGKFFAKERDRNNSTYHFNLYAINEDENEVLMTKDHIVPIGKGGSNNCSNYQTLCAVCNQEKANK